jgi:hypothetical protein
MHEVEQMHPLIDQLTAARALRLHPPLAFVANAPAVAVAAAHRQQIAVIAAVHLVGEALDAGVEAVVEANLDAAAAGQGRRRDLVDLLGPKRGRLLDEDVSARSATPASWSWVTAAITTSAPFSSSASRSG